MILNASSDIGSLVVGLAQNLFALVIDALDGRNVDRARQIIHHGVEQRLHALVLEGRTAQHRIEGAGQNRLADHTLQGRLVGLIAVEKRRQDLVVEFDRGLDHLLAIFLGLIEHIGGNVDVLEIGAERLVFPDHALHADEIDEALELALRTDRKLDRNRLRAKTLHDVVETLEEIGAGLVHLVGEHDARDAILVALAPDGLGLRLDALVAVENDDGAVQHAQRTLDFDGEVDVARGVDDVEALVFPDRSRGSRRDRDAALLLLLHEIHGRSAVMHFADLVALAGVIEDPLGGRGLSGIDVSHDAEIAVVLDRVTAGHLRSFTSGNARRRGWLPPCDARLRAS